MRHFERSAGRLSLALAMMAAASLGLAGCDQFSKGFNKGFNDKFDKDTHDSCLTSAQQNGATAAGAERYCTCVVKELDKLTVQQKMSLNPQSPEVSQAAATCVAQTNPTSP